MKILSKFILKLLLMPIFILVCFLKFITSWLGKLSYIILYLLSGAAMLSGLIGLLYSWGDGTLAENFLSWILIFGMAFAMSALGFFIMVIPVSLELLAEKMLNYILS